MAQDAAVTAAEIARLAGVGRAAVSNWRKRHDDFPQPVGGTATSPTFSLSEIQDWLGAQGKLSGATADEFLWQDLRKLADEGNLADVLTLAGSFLLYLHRAPGAWASLEKLSDEQLARELPEAVGGDFVSPIAKKHVPIVRRVAELASERSPRDTFEFLRARYLDLHKRRAYETPPAVTSLATRLAGPGVETVFDPACGSGGFLLAALENVRPTRVVGQDIDADLTRLTALRLALRTENVEIRSGDSLRDDAFPEVEADLVATAPPFNDRNWGYDELSTDLRWEYGLPPRTEPELAWVQHALTHTRPGGLAVVLMPPAAANRRAGRRIRQQLLRRGALRAVIGLPLGAVPNMAVPLALWVLRRPTPGERPPSQVLMAEASDGFADRTLDAWRRFTSDPEVDLDEPGQVRAVRIIDLLDEEVDLTPARYIAQPTGALALDQVEQRRAEVLELLRGLPALIPEVQAAPQLSDAPLISVADLVRMGHLALVHASSSSKHDNESLPNVLTVDDVTRNRQPVASTHPTAPDHVALQAGDVVVPAVIRTPAAMVVEQAGGSLGRHLLLLRPDPNLLDPHYLAGILRSSLNIRNYTATSTSYRVDIRRAEIPVPAIDVQRGHGEDFRRLYEFSTRLRLAADVGTDLAALITDGLIDSILKPRRAR
ncbi:N-6 DNA methylase [Actinomadura logoneensis]|uniref:N-6 DNA methylase n=1 Tax=Actinomadura logoneensis TaxID=2293572 RepID=A0A372JHC9_9ACTN|nr:N-6 DNA methylase [Actinomadura logoneensis]RFU39422.1 N-6 DNA methylase [Actinomadura logoneensis]